MNMRKKIEDALRSKRGLSGVYTATFEENLIDNTTAGYIQEQLSQGSGSELVGEKPKSQSVGSSAALAVNTFVPWIHKLNDLRVGGAKVSIRFSLRRKCRLN